MGGGGGLVRRCDLLSNDRESEGWKERKKREREGDRQSVTQSRLEN